MALWWVTQGYIALTPEEEAKGEGGYTRLEPGSGYLRKWTQSDLTKMYAMAKLRRTGFAAAQASVIADRIVAGDLTVNLSNGIVLIVPENFLIWEAEELCS